jgi:diguanylate cyclase (GGDEF)-like protein
VILFERVVPSIDYLVEGRVCVGRKFIQDISRVALGAIVTLGVLGVVWQRRYRRIRDEAERRTLLFHAAQQIGDSLDLEELYTAIHRAVARMMPCDALVISLLDAECQELEDVYLFDKEGRWPGTRYPAGTGIVGYTINSGASVRIDDFTDEVVATTGAQFFGNTETRVRSLMMVLMRRGTQVVGVLSAQAKLPHTYTSADLEILELLSANAAIAIENARLFAETRRLAITDGLTGVYNRRHFFELAEHEWTRAIRYKREVAVMMIDADHFKRVNDTLGHMIGDEVLRAIALRCGDTIRAIDVMGRYGGEEFAVLLPETSLEQAQQVAERLRLYIAATPIITNAGPLTMTVSIGVASCGGQAHLSLDQLLDRADQALYMAKRQGRNMVYLWSTQPLAEEASA